MSGSDDLNAIVWDPLQSQMKCCIKTGHSGNIFSVKVLHYFYVELKDVVVVSSSCFETSSWFDEIINISFQQHLSVCRLQQF